MNPTTIIIIVIGVVIIGAFSCWWIKRQCWLSDVRAHARAEAQGYREANYQSDA